MELKVLDVSFTYDASTAESNRALSNVSFTVNDGDFFGITGNTGSGKSTLIRLLNGLLKPSSGSIIIDGADIYKNKMPLNEIRAKVGLVFQYPEHQLFGRTVLEDVMFGPLNIGMDEESAKEAGVKALSALGISPALFERDPLELSGGEKRRVAIAGVLAMEPSVVVLDEPASALDCASRNRLFETLTKLNKDGKTIIMVSHDEADIIKYCNRALVLEKGTVKACGEVKDLSIADSHAQSVIKQVIKALEEKGILIPADLYTSADGDFYDEARFLEFLKTLLKRR